MMYEQEWFHGTEVQFTSWQVPPPIPKHKPGIFEHTAVFLTTDIELARGAGESKGGLCSAKLKRGFNILDTSCQTIGLEEFRVAVSSKPIGSKCVFPANNDLWFQAWQTGAVMRFTTTDPVLGIYLTEKAKLGRSVQRTQESISAFNEVQNFTRCWIEELAQTAKELGYQGLIGHEIDSDRPSGPKSCKVLFVLSQEILTKPKWIRVPKYPH
jgi:hypothetical protein